MKLFFLCLLGMVSVQAGSEEPKHLFQRVTDGASVPPSELYLAMIKKPEVAKKNEELKKQTLKLASSRGPKETKEDIDLKVKALKSAAWFDEWTKTGFIKVNEYAAEMIHGEFVHATEGQNLFAVLHDANAENPWVQVRFFSSLALMRDGMHPEDALDKIKNASVDHLKRVEDELIKTQPESAFWFKGANWEGAPLQKIQRLFPKLYAMAVQECDLHRKDPVMDPAHVIPEACSLLK